MFKFASSTKPTPSMNRSLNLPSTPHLPDEAMPTPTYEQPGDRSIKNYKKVVLAVASLAVVGTVAALALYNPSASTTNASVGTSVIGSTPEHNNQAPPQHPELAAELDRLASQNAVRVPYLRVEASPDNEEDAAVAVPYLVGSKAAPADNHKGLELELLKAKHDAKSVERHEERPSKAKLLELLQAKKQHEVDSAVVADDFVAVPYLVGNKAASADNHMGLELELLKAKHDAKSIERHEEHPSQAKLLELLQAKKQAEVDSAVVADDDFVAVPYLVSASQSSDDEVAHEILGKELELLKAKHSAKSAGQPDKGKLLELLQAGHAKSVGGSDLQRKELDLLKAKADKDTFAKVQRGDDVQVPREALEKLLILLSEHANADADVKVPYIID